MGFSKGKSTETLEDIQEKVSEFQILAYYFNVTCLPCVIKSPLRKDSHPSLGVFVNDKGQVKFRDFRTKESGGIIDLLSAYWKTGYTDTVAKLSDDIPNFKDSKVDNSIIIKTGAHKRSKHVYSSETDLQCKTRDWKQHDLQYWAKFGISKKWLDFGNVYPITHLIITKQEKSYVIPADKYAYVYIEFKDGTPSLKVYQPFSTTHKWLNKHDASVWDLWDQLPTHGSNLIITSSRKDALCIWENTGIPSCSLQAESYIPKEHVVEQLKDRFRNIYILYDNDYDKETNYGKVLGESLSKEFGLTQIEIPQMYKSKDPSDLFKNHNKIIVREVINSLIKKQINY